MILSSDHMFQMQTFIFRLKEAESFLIKRSSHSKHIVPHSCTAVDMTMAKALHISLSVCGPVNDFEPADGHIKPRTHWHDLKSVIALPLAQSEAKNYVVDLLEWLKWCESCLYRQF